MKIVICLFALVAVALAEPPSSYAAPSFNSASSSYSAPSFQSFSSGGGYDDDGGDSSNFVDAELLARVAQILAQSESSSSSRAYQPPSNSYGAPPQDSYGPPQQVRDSYGPPPQDSYGPPSQNFRSGGQINLGTPERAERVAEWSTSSGGNNFRSSGGYS